MANQLICLSVTSVYVSACECQRRDVIFPFLMQCCAPEPNIQTFCLMVERFTIIPNVGSEVIQTSVESDYGWCRKVFRHHPPATLGLGRPSETIQNLIRKHKLIRIRDVSESTDCSGCFIH